MSAVTVPPIPARLVDRPTVGGLVIPWISIHIGTGERYLLGQVHRSRAVRCITEHRCQIDGEALDRRRVAFANQRGIDAGYTEEPAMHPECAAYSALACPMVAGQMATYRRHPLDTTGLACSEPGCGCDGWVPEKDRRTKAGQPAEAWFALWLDGYDIAVTPSGEVLGVAWRTCPPRRIRPIGGRDG